MSDFPSLGSEEEYLNKLREIFAAQCIRFSKKGDDWIFFTPAGETAIKIPVHHLPPNPQSILAVILSRSGMNQRIFARNCEIKKLSRVEADNFIHDFHLMGSARCAYYYGIFLKDRLLSVAAFSKGRKMNRLPANKRSFELIRYCCLPGITVTGGLSKLITNFAKEKSAGDIMTYIDPSFSDGSSYLRAGFKQEKDSSFNKHGNIKLIYKVA